MKIKNRREFLKKGVLGISAAALMPAVTKAQALSIAGESIPTRTLGKTGIRIPVLSMGTGDTNNSALVKKALESGVKLFATSSYYGNGNNESMLGELLKDVPRDFYLIATSSMPKGTDHQNGIFTDNTAGEAFKKDIEAGMKRLKVDYLDILFLPFAAKRESVFFEPLLRVMEDFKKSGKARFLGIATHSYIDQAIRAAADTGIYDVVMTAYNFRMEQLKEVEDAIQYGVEKGLGMIAMKTMAGVYWDKERTQPISSKAALKWILRNENIHTLMSGMTTFDQLQSNIEMANNPAFGDEEMKELRLAHTGSQGLFCLNCRDCEGQCTGNIDIPTLMRSYMYAYGYRNMHHARQTLDMVTTVACNDCDSCSVNCRAGFDVKQKIMNIEQLREVPVEFLG